MFERSQRLRGGFDSFTMDLLAMFMFLSSEFVDLDDEGKLEVFNRTGTKTMNVRNGDECENANKTTR
jgi:hypothetical protein